MTDKTQIDGEALLGEVAKTITEQGKAISIPILHPTWWERLKGEKVRTFSAKPLTLGKLIQVSELILKIEKSASATMDGLDFTASLAFSNGRNLAQIVAICFSPNRTPTCKEANFILDNVTVEELKNIVETVLSQMNIQNFLISIVTLKGTNILRSETSPQEPKEIIAFGEQSEA